jgi:mono/diheme cytochrome c family protein
MLRRLLLPVALTAAVLLFPNAASSQSPSEFYDQHCAGCHTIGQGAAAGPDLRDLSRRRDREWVIRFLLNPGDFRSDPVVARMIEEAGGLEMPDTEGLTREMAAALLDLIDRRSTAVSDSAGATEGGPRGTRDEPTHPADVARGSDLFTGRARLSSGAPPCVHCHDAAALAAPGGGRMGPDLTTATARLGGVRGVAGWLRAAPTPVMRAVYRSAAFAPDEPRQLAAFLDDASARTPVPPQARAVPFVTAALVLATIAVALIAVLGSQRFRSVRAPMVARATGSHATRRGQASGGS